MIRLSIPSFQTNPIAQAEWRVLQRTRVKPGRWRLTTRAALFLLSASVATLPLWHYINGNHDLHLLGFMLALLTLANWLIGGRTLLLASDAISREQRQGRWDTLLLTGVDARRLLIGKWWATVRYVWKDHARMTLPRIGLALAFVEFLHRSYLESLGWSYRWCPCGTAINLWINHQLRSFAAPFDYYSGGSGSAYPGVVTTLLGAGLLVAIALAEAALLAALGLLAGLAIKRQQQFIRPLLAGGLRLALAGVMVVLYFAAGNNLPRLIHFEVERGCGWSNSLNGYICSKTYTDAHLAGERPQHAEISVAFRAASIERARIIETLQLGLLSLADGGTLTTANIMRPTCSPNTFYKKQWNLIAYYQLGNGSRPLFEQICLGNSLFVLRNSFSVLLSLMIFGLCTRWTLFAARTLAARRYRVSRA